jgi:rhamnosyltransferase
MISKKTYSDKKKTYSKQINKKMRAADMGCSIVIRAYNEEKHIGRLLEGIQNQTVKNVEIILVDSGSTDATVPIAKSFGAQIRCIAPEEFTFGRSLNLGIRATSNELVVIASAHVYPVYPDWLNNLLSPFEDSEIGLTYGKQRGPKEARFSEQQIFQQWYPDLNKPRQETVFCNNANAAIRKSLWENNPYEEKLPGLEDLAWTKRVKQQGYAVSYVSDAEVVHSHNETPRDVQNRYRREAMAFKQIYPEAHFSLYDFIYLTISNIISDIWHASCTHELRSNLVSIIWFRFMQFYGTRLGYLESGTLTPQLRELFYYARQRKPRPDQIRSIKPIQYNDLLK